MRLIGSVLGLAFGLLLVCSAATQAGASDLDTIAEAACGEGNLAVVLCGGQEALCVPAAAGCGIATVSCCPPCTGEGCPTQTVSECTGSRATCVGCDVCFTASLDRKMAPVLGPAPLVALMLGLVAAGFGILRRRLT